MPLNLSLKNKMAGTIQEDTTFLKPDGWDPIYALLEIYPNAAPQRRWMGLLKPDPLSRCLRECCKVLGAAQYRIERKTLVCSKLVSYGYGPLMMLALAKLAHDKKLVLVAQGPFSQDALSLLRRLVTEPIDNLSVQENQMQSFAITYTQNANVDAEFAQASERLATHLQRPAEGMHKRWHVESDLAELIRIDDIVKAALAHH